MIWPTKSVILINSFPKFVDFLNQSDYDIIHCSNEPDILVNIALCSNKKVIHDSHDVMSMCYTVSWEQNALEYISNTKSDGLVFVSPLCTEYAVKRYNIPENKYLILENYIIEHMKPQIY